MSKYHVIVSNSDGEIVSHLNLSLVGMLNITFKNWVDDIEDSNLSDEDILVSMEEYWGSQPVMCVAQHEYPLQVYISNRDELYPYDMDRLFESKKALLKWARNQIKKKLSEKSNK